MRYPSSCRTISKLAILVAMCVMRMASPTRSNGYLFQDVDSIVSTPPTTTSSSCASSTIAFVSTQVPVIQQRKRPRTLIISNSGANNIQRQSDILLSMTSSSKDSDTNNEADNNNNNDDNGLSWRLAKVRLEESHTRSFLTRKPLKLSYSVSQKWIQNNWAPKTQQEFEDLVANGNLRTPYISKRPEEYYGERGEWISWDHYLLGSCTEGKNGTDVSEEVLKWQ